MEIRAKIDGIENADIEPELVAFIDRLTSDIPKSYNEVTDESAPSGRLYRIGAITGRRSARLAALGLRNKAGTKTRLIAGSRIHRASAQGQPAARLSGKLTQRIKVVKRGKFIRVVQFDAPYSGFVFASRPVGFEKAIDRSIERTPFE